MSFALTDTGTGTLKWLTVALIAVAAALLTRAALGASSELARAATGYVEYLDDLSLRCCVPRSGRRTLRVQSCVALCSCALGLLLRSPWIPLALLPPTAIIPAARLLLAYRRRRAACDAQASTFCTTLANLLRTIPNVQGAIEAAAATLKAPLSDELRFALAELALGTPLDAALLSSAARCKSRGFEACVSALLVGHQVGGNLPALLETTAATLREMERIDGVVQSRTAEGRAQLAVLAFLPAAILVAFSVVSPGYFAPLQEEWLGRLILAGAGVLWLSAMFLAKAIMVVDV